MTVVVFRGTQKRSQALDGRGPLNAFQRSSVIVAGALTVAIGFAAARQAVIEAPPLATASVTTSVEAATPVPLSSMPAARDPRRSPALVPPAADRSETSPAPASIDHSKDQARLENERQVPQVSTPPAPSKLSYIKYYPYAEIPLPEKPADLVLASLKDVPVGTPIEEVKRAAAAFGMDVSFMKAVAKIESGFDPTQRTGSYIGLFQLSHYEFEKYGSGDILDARDNAIAAAYKFLTEADLFEWDTHKKPTFSDLYLIHQQGWQGAAEHVAHPERIAWKSMCATDEGKEKGEKWCKRAVWGNTLPRVKETWKSVERITSAAFVAMWQQRLNLFLARYSAASTEAAAAGTAAAANR
jgi:soluble lytic murein transglycosylase-like protein